MRVRVLIADDHALFRQGLRTLLQAAKGIDVVAEAGDGEEAVRLAERWAPDIVLMDVTMPRLDGIEATRRIRAAVPGAQVVALTMHADASLAKAMRDAGAVAFLDKNSDLSALVERIRAAAAPLPTRTRGAVARGAGIPDQGGRPASGHRRQDGRDASRTHHGQARHRLRRRAHEVRHHPRPAHHVADPLPARRRTLVRDSLIPLGEPPSYDPSWRFVGTVCRRSSLLGGGE